MVLYEITIIFTTLFYVVIGYAMSTLSKDPDFKAFTFIFWPLLVFYYALFVIVATIRRLVIKFIDWSIGGTQ